MQCCVTTFKIADSRSATHGTYGHAAILIIIYQHTNGDLKTKICFEIFLLHYKIVIKNEGGLKFRHAPAHTENRMKIIKSAFFLTS
jgi:hypothetical protein